MISTEAQACRRWLDIQAACQLRRTFTWKFFSLLPGRYTRPCSTAPAWFDSPLSLASCSALT